MNHLQVNALDAISSGLNIEGGLPYEKLVKDNPSKSILWSNLILVLDRPLIDNILFEDLAKSMQSNNYLLLENTVDNINEHKMFTIYLMIIGYYLEHGRRLLNRNSSDHLTITCHMHQDIASVELLNILAKMVDELCSCFKLDMSKLTINYKTDKYTFISSKHNYTNTDILISLSQCAGLDPKIKPGEMIIANQFIPYNVTKKEINTKKQYTVPNHLVYTIDDILNSSYYQYSMDYVNTNYKSGNPAKCNHRANKITREDFHESQILQVNDLWNPINETEVVTII